MNNLKIYIFIAVTSFAVACSKPSPEPTQKATAIAVDPASANKPGELLTADPNPIIVTDGSGLGETVINWRSTASIVDIRVEAFNGKLFTTGGSTGSNRTGKWVRKGSQFFMQDHNASDPTSAAATLATLTVDVR